MQFCTPNCFYKRIGALIMGLSLAMPWPASINFTGSLKPFQSIPSFEALSPRPAFSGKWFIPIRPRKSNYALLLDAQILSLLRKYRDYPGLTASRVGELLSVESIDWPLIRRILERLFEDNRIFRLKGGSQGQDTIYTLKKLDLYPAAVPTELYTPIDIARLLYFYKGPMTRGLIRYYFRDFAGSTDQLYSVLVSMIKSDLVEKSGTEGKYFYQLTRASTYKYKGLLTYVPKSLKLSA
jgi:hypothetical protein